MLERGDFSEKRDFIRMGVDCPTTFEIEGESGSFNGTARDLSASGLQIVTQKEVAIGTILNIKVLPEKAIIAPLHAVVEVVWKKGPIGNQFELGVSIREMK
ncbi:MAG: PilZ domain-containing protein [Gammaproteobacteria bacterium]|nr:PilZ domain-containing protein [Gammaproteobacteria bacterium]